MAHKVQHTPDETAITIASFLPIATDLLHLAMACRRYSIKIVAKPASIVTGSFAAAWSFAEEAARRWIADAAPRSRGPGRHVTDSRTGYS
jgi:hypothetical protein